MNVAISTLTIRHDRASGDATFFLHWRDPKRVGHAGGMYQVVAGGLVASAWQIAVAPGLGAYPGLAFTVFGAIEHVNYFHRQISPAGRPWVTVLMPRSWPRSHLARDLSDLGPGCSGKSRS